ncbi:MAG: NAD(+)/NADH kinase, partial [Planctomycetales bacterium]|nr:NAD(+)/NADH kinase [Planctomycetales bacterium]
TTQHTQRHDTHRSSTVAAHGTPSSSAASMIVLVNAKAGLDDKTDCQVKLEAALAAAGVAGEVRSFSGGEELLTNARRAVDEGCRMLVAAGGDGTVSACASIVVGTDVVLGVLPMGTLNHFAKDLNIPLTLPEAVRNLADGEVRTVDVGEVNGRVFVNNSSIGIYPELVKHREQQQRLGKHKWSAFARAFWTVLGRYPMISVSVNADGLAKVCKTPLVFIGNNPYAMAGLRMGTRDRLDTGRLAVYLTRDVGRRRLFTFALRALFGRLRDEHDFQTIETESLTIRTKRDHLRVAADGEIAQLDSPLEYKIRPRALKVVAPIVTPATNVSVQ